MRGLFDRKGFTLIELSVVMAVAAIVGTMIVAFMIFSSNQQAEITTEAKRISETTEIQKVINNWIKKYDSEAYTYTVSNSATPKIKAMRKSDSQIVSELYLSNTKICEKISTVETAKTESLNNIQGVRFDTPTHVTSSGTVPEQIIKVTVTYDNGNTQTLLFPLFSNVTRQRKVEGR